MEPADGVTDFQPHFWPKDYYAGLAGWDLEANKMGEEEIRALGVAVTSRRKDLRQAALLAGSQDDLKSSQQAIERLAKRMTRGYFHAYQPRLQLHEALKAEVPALCQR